MRACLKAAECVAFVHVKTANGVCVCWRAIVARARPKYVPAAVSNIAAQIVIGNRVTRFVSETVTARTVAMMGADKAVGIALMTAPVRLGSVRASRNAKLIFWFKKTVRRSIVALLVWPAV